MFAYNKIIDTTGPVRFVGRWAWLTSIVGFGYLLLTGLIITIGLPYGYRLLTHTCQDTCEIYGQLSVANAQDLQKIGISIETYATIYVIVLVIFTVICLGAGGLILWKKPGELLPFCAAALIMGLVSIEGQYVFFSDFFQDYPVLGKIYEYLDVPGNLFGIYLFLTFPNGKFKGKIFWFLYVALGITPSLFYLYAEVFGVEFNVDPIQLSLPIAGPITIVALVVSFWREKSFSWRSVARYLGYALICLIALLINVYLTGFIVYLVVLIYRSNKILTPRERIPTKWVIYGFTVFMLTVVPAFTIAPLFPALYEPGTYYFILFNLLGFFGCGINLTGFLMAVLYANAFDINLVIKRTVVYTALTFLIIGIYLGSVVVLQELVRSLTGQQSSLAVVGATLVAALLFQPLHHAIQGFVDRRFFRRKYNAAQTINILTSSLQNETDLPTLTRQVKAVIDETMQPEMVTVWVRKSGQVKPFHRPEL